jgi:hypothetical protein
MEKQSLNQQIDCIYPWSGLAIRPDGLAIPCCMYDDRENLNFKNSNLSMSDLRNSLGWSNIRYDMSKGQFPIGCVNCKKDEDLGIYSLRKNGLKKFIPIKTQKPTKIKILEMAFSNLCDSACLHCGSYFSSKWGSEDYLHGRSTKKSKIQINNDLEHEDLSEVEILKIIGGEPLLEQGKFTALLERINLENCSIKLCTNGRHFPNPQLLEKLVQAKNLLFVISVDGIDSLNDWYRWPSKWEEIVKTIDIVENKLCHLPNVYFHLHCCINVYNVFYLEEIINYFRTKWPNWKIEWDWIRYPEWQSISILPADVKEILIDNLTDLGNDLQDLSMFCDQNPYMITVNKLKENSSLSFDNCVKNTIRISTERRMPVREMIPKFFKAIGYDNQ